MSRLQISISLLCFLSSIISALPLVLQPNASSTLQANTLSPSDLDYWASLLSSNTSSTNLSPSSNLSTTTPLQFTALSTLFATSPVSCLPNPLPLDIDDYLEVVEEIVSLPTSMQPQNWRLSSTDPTTWGDINCKIALGVVPSGASQGWVMTDEVFQPVYVAHLATKIASQCLTPEVGFHGGLIKFGDRFGLGVVLGPGRREGSGSTGVA